jgi:AcrR family transcriptional regulator
VPASDRPVVPGKPRAVDRIRESARKLFYREGIRAVGVDEIVTTAGVTKPSLYRSFSSKDALAASYLTDFDADFWRSFEESVAAHPGDPRAQILAYFSRVGRRTCNPGYRGCALTNAAVEYPTPGHPARLVAEANKRELRARFIEMASAMGAADQQALGDGLLLLFEGALVSAQLFGADGPGPRLAETAERLIDASLR